MNITVRRFAESDAAEVSALIVNTLRTTNIKDYSLEYIEKDVAQFTPGKVIERASWTHFYVFCDGQRIVGCGAIGPYWGSETESSLFNIFVLPEYQGKGVGRKIIETLEADEYALRAKRIEIPASITACTFYRKMGYDYKNGIDTVDAEQLYRLEKYRVPFLHTVRFEPYSHKCYQAVCDFLVAANREKKHINWNWARWEWMYAHPYCDREKLHTIGLWLDGAAVVGAAIYDLFHGEAFCGALDGYDSLLRSILEYAYNHLKNENGLGIAVRDDDISMQELLTRMGYGKAEQTEPVLYRDLNGAFTYALPAGFSIREIRFPEDNLAYQTVIWKGFDHEGDDAELEKMLRNPVLPPNRRSELCLSVVDENGEFAAHCTCWYDERTDYAYVEPVCTIPKYRGMGLGKAVVCEALNRCAKLGARSAFVISDQEFYKKLGFQPDYSFRFFWKN